MRDVAEYAAFSTPTPVESNELTVWNGAIRKTEGELQCASEPGSKTDDPLGNETDCVDLVGGGFDRKSVEATTRIALWVLEDVHHIEDLVQVEWIDVENAGNLHRRPRPRVEGKAIGALRCFAEKNGTHTEVRVSFCG